MFEEEKMHVSLSTYLKNMKILQNEIYLIENDIHKILKGLNKCLN